MGAITQGRVYNDDDGNIDNDNSNNNDDGNNNDDSSNNNDDGNNANDGNDDDNDSDDIDDVDNDNDDDKVVCSTAFQSRINKIASEEQKSVFLDWNFRLAFFHSNKNVQSAFLQLVLSRKDIYLEIKKS